MHTRRVSRAATSLGLLCSMRASPGYCEKVHKEMTRQLDVQSPSHCLGEKYPGLALMLQSRPKDVAALGTRLVCIA